MESTLKELWTQADRKLIPQEKLNEDHIIKSIRMKSKHTIGRLKIKFMIGILVNLFVISLLIYYMSIMDHLLFQILNVVILFSLGFTTYLCIKAYLELKKSLNDNLKESLSTCYNKLRVIISNQILIETMLFGVLVLAFLFKSIVDGRFVADDPIDWIRYLVALFVAIPLGYFIARWNHRRHFGSYMKVLKRNIQSLE